MFNLSGLPMHGILMEPKEPVSPRCEDESNVSEAPTLFFDIREWRSAATCALRVTVRRVEF